MGKRHTKSMIVIVPASRPRNPLVAAAKMRLAGAHDTPHKVKRRDGKQALRREMLGLNKKDGDAVLFVVGCRQ